MLNRRAFLIFFSFFMVLGAYDAVLAQDSLWVKGIEGRVSMEGRTPEQARNEALQRAREKAVKTAVGTTLLSSFFMQQSELVRNNRVEEANDSAVKLIIESAGALVLRDSVISVRFQNMAHEGEMPRADYVVIIDALVVKERGSPDPDFALTLSGVRDSYKPDEKLNLDVTATKDCYVNVFSLGADGFVYHVFPNLREKDNTLRADTKRTIPGSPRYSLRVILPENKAVSSETLLVVATKDSSSFRLGEPFRLDVGYVEMRRAVLEKLMGWILQVPKDRRVEASQSYIIRR